MVMHACCRGRASVAEQRRPYRSLLAVARGNSSARLQAASWRLAGAWGCVVNGAGQYGGIHNSLTSHFILCYLRNTQRKITSRLIIINTSVPLEPSMTPWWPSPALALRPSVPLFLFWLPQICFPVWLRL
ncbi:unnamed protein product [Periconia digitata]|uniref:Uncharacterized protein n=1 Tax=Periconia digitata TaxID=1303443 RepID=A0A9W4XTG3_9PLEO|nr:unnamed protein product [Periconia digitata]